MKLNTDVIRIGWNLLNWFLRYGNSQRFRDAQTHSRTNTTENSTLPAPKIFGGGGIINLTIKSQVATLTYCVIIIIIRPRRSRSAAAYSHQTFPWTICRSVCRSVCPVHCGKTADRIRQPFGTIGRTGPRMRQILGFANRSTGRGTFGGEFGPHHCNQWGLYGVRVRQCINRRRCGLGWCLRWAEALLC